VVLYPYIKNKSDYKSKGEIKMKHRILAFLLSTVSGLVYAGSNSTLLTINGSVSASCTLSATAITLPGSISSTQTGTSNLTVNCSNSLPYNLTVTSTNAWNLKDSSTNLVAYTLAYTGSNTSVNSTWSGGAANAQVTSTPINGTGVNQTYPLRVTSIAPSSAVPPGTYSDIVTINVIY
jgi:spore coat protein U-like protein